MSHLDLLYALLPQAILDTLWMTVASSFFTLLFGLPLGLLLYTTARGGLFQSGWINHPASLVVDSLRAIPFLILAISIMPITRLVIGTTYGNGAMIFVLSISAIPFYARMAELSFRNLDRNLVDAVRTMGASRLQIIREVILPESLASLITGFTVTVIAILAASSLAGFIGGGGLGKIAISYGYQRYILVIMIPVLVVLIILNMLIQWFGDRLAYRINRKKQN